ncbi:MAG: RluA family pseudouridine synthase [Patescibacteria group bacterium]
MQIEILYEDDNLLAINKPSGLKVHGDGRTSDETLADWVLEKYPALKDVGEPGVLSDGRAIARPGIVHRIDAETSGVLVLVKNQETFLHLKNQFQTRAIKKHYNTFVYGVPKGVRAVINRPIGKSRRDPRLWSAQRGARGVLREAITQYRVAKTGTAHAYLDVFPRTGRTHQIRVHMKAINHPIVCDRLYAPVHEPALGFTRLALHATAITMIDITGREHKFEAPLPADFQNALKNLQ